MFLRFLLVGGGFSLSYALVTAALIRFAGAPPFWTSVLCYVVAIPLAYTAHRRFAFQVEETRPAAFALYVATQVGALALVSAVTTHFVSHHFARDTLLLLVTSGLAAVLSFAIGRFVTFAPQT
jgi:putative flippase GtrA